MLWRGSDRLQRRGTGVRGREEAGPCQCRACMVANVYRGHCVINALNETIEFAPPLFYLAPTFPNPSHLPHLHFCTGLGVSVQAEGIAVSAPFVGEGEPERHVCAFGCLLLPSVLQLYVCCPCACGDFCC